MGAMGGSVPNDWNWFDPDSQTRFEARKLTIDPDATTERRLQNIIRLIDRIFDHISVFEQYDETRGNGRAGLRATAQPERKLSLPAVTATLSHVERQLGELQKALEGERERFLRQQLNALGIDQSTRGLKLHLGSAGYLIDGWLNIDAGGADLTLNVNWGLPFPDGSARFLYCSHLLEHLRYTDQAPVLAREVHRVLEPGGIARFVVPDLEKLLAAYARRDQQFFTSRQEFYPLPPSFLRDGVATLDYLLLFAGAAPQQLGYNHKFGYDSAVLCKLLEDAGFSSVQESAFQASQAQELRVDTFSYNTHAKQQGSEHYSIFVEAIK